MEHTSDITSRHAERRNLAAAIASILAASAASALAQTGEPPTRELEKISVQADEHSVGQLLSPKFTAAPVNTPQTTTVIPEQLFDQQGAQNLTEVLRNTPGITFNAGENGFATGTSNFSIRGFDSSSSVYIDGVRDSGNYYRDVFNVQQVEVVKGASGDNGRGSAGGYVNLVTKTPQAENFVQAAASFGFDSYDSDNLPRASIDVNHAFSDSTALRLNGTWQDGGAPGRDVATLSGWGFAPSLALGLGTDTRFIAAYQHAEQNDIPDWGVPAAFIPGMLNHDQNLDGDALRDEFYGLSSDFDDVTTDSALARIEHDFSETLSLSNQTRWSHTNRDAQYTVPTGYAPATQLVTTQRQAYARENTNLSNQTSLVSSFATGPVQHRFSAGLELSREESTADRFATSSNPGTGAPISVFDPDSNRAPGIAPLAPTQTSDVRIDTIAAYAYDTLQFNDRWQLTGGMRVEHYEVEIDSGTVAGAPLGADDFQTSKTTVSGKLGLVYKPRENGSVYGSVGISALPPGSFLSNPDISREGDNAFPGWSAGLNSEGSKVQRSINYEIGTKWTAFDDRFIASAALFRTERENVAISGRDPGVAPLPPVALLGYGEQLVQGLEIGVGGQITDAWSIIGGVAFMESERTHSAFLDEARRLANPADYGTTLRTSGDELAFTPEVTANLWTTYRLPFGLTLGGGVRHVGSSWLGRPDDAERIIPNGTFGKLPSYTVVDMLVSYDFNEKVGVRLNANNVTDELYAVSTNWPGTRAALGQPRSYVLSADFRF